MRYLLQCTVQLHPLHSSSSIYRSQRIHFVRLAYRTTFVVLFNLFYTAFVVTITAFSIALWTRSLYFYHPCLIRRFSSSLYRKKNNHQIASKSRKRKGPHEEHGNLCIRSSIRRSAQGLYNLLMTKHEQSHGVSCTAPARIASI